jgi:Domain of unknown function (DUF4783)
MRKFVYILICMTGLLSFASKPMGEDVISAFSSGDAERISLFLDDPVYLTLPGKSSSFDKQTAKVVLRDFFSNRKVRQFSVIHKGGNEASHFFIGNLSTSSGTFRTTIYLKKKNAGKTIQEIRIESN